jgi:hypothetical protein
MWTRRVEKGKIIVEVSALEKWSKVTERGVRSVVKRFEAFATGDEANRR